MRRAPTRWKSLAPRRSKRPVQERTFSPFDCPLVELVRKSVIPCGCGQLLSPALVCRAVSIEKQVLSMDYAEGQSPLAVAGMVRCVALVAPMASVALVRRCGHCQAGLAQMERHRRLNETVTDGPKRTFEHIAASQHKRRSKKRPIRHKLLRDSVSLQSVLLAPSNAK